MNGGTIRGCSSAYMGGCVGVYGTYLNVYAIGYDPDIDCDDPNGDCYQHYEEALNFLCELNIHEPDNTEHRDVALCHRSWQHREVLRDTLASLDMIADMANENNNKNV